MKRFAFLAAVAAVCLCFVGCRQSSRHNILLTCVLDGDVIVLTWEAHSGTGSVQLFENGVQLEPTDFGLEFFDVIGELRLEDRDPGAYVYEADGHESHRARCELIRKARLVVQNACDEDEVARVLIDPASEGDLPILLNTKVLLLDVGEVVTSDERLVMEVEPRGSCVQVDSFFDVFYEVELRGETREGTFSTIEVLLNGEPVDPEDIINCGDHVKIRKQRVCEPGRIDLTVNLSAVEEFEVEVDTNEGEPNGDSTVIETEIVALSLTSTVPVTQREVALFGAGDEELHLPASCYADVFLDEQSNVGNRVILVPDVAAGWGYGSGHGVGYGFGIGRASGWDYVDLDVTGSAWYHDYVRAYGFGVGHFFDNDLQLVQGDHWWEVEIDEGDWDSVFVPVATGGWTSGPVWHDLEASGWNYVSLPVSTNVFTQVNTRVSVNVWVPIISHEDVSTDFVTKFAGLSAIGRPDCRAFGVGREAGHLTLGFCDNIIYNGPGYDLRIFERSPEEATEMFFALLSLDRFYNARDAEEAGFVPTRGDSFILPTDQWVQDLTAPLGFVVRTADQLDELGLEYDGCGYVIDVDLDVLADRLGCANLITFLSDGAGNSIEGNLRELFFGADIDAVKGLNNRYGLRILPTPCTLEAETEEEEDTVTLGRDLLISCLFLTEEDLAEYDDCEKLWRYKLCGQVFCDGLKADPLLTNEVEMSSPLRPYFLRYHLKVNALGGLADTAEYLEELFGLSVND